MQKIFISLFSCLFFSTMFLSTLFFSPVAAQTVTLTSPITAQNIKTGDDYFTDVLGVPSDGSNRRMIGWEENFNGTSISAQSGIWKGTTSIAGAYVFPLFPGLKGTLIADSLPGDKKLPKFGSKYPIQASKYSHFAYKMNHSNPSALAIYWDSNISKPQWWPTIESPHASRTDSNSNHNNTNSLWNIRHFNMLDLPANFPVRNGSWSGNIHVLRLDPSTGAPPGSTIQFDWIRLVDPASAPMVTITWTSAGLNSNHMITVYQNNTNNNTNSGYSSGTPIAKLPHSATSYTFPSAMLPPGKHYFYVAAGLPAGGGGYTGTPARSLHSALLNIKKKPEITITAPAPDSGDSYSVKTRGKEWDMGPAGTDVYNLRDEFPQLLRQFLYPSFASNPNATLSGHVFQALAEPPYYHVGNQESDVQVHFEISPGQPIDPKHYRYIVYRMAIGEDSYPTISDKVGHGWVSRVIGWNQNVLQDVSATKAHIVYEGWNAYWYDLASNDSLETGYPWTSFSSLRKLRLDPGEFNLPGVSTWFFLDYFKLMSENRTTNNSYNIKYTIAGEPGDTYSVSIYHDTDQKGFNGTLITTLNGVSAGTHSYSWNTSALPENKEYYIYMVVNDGTQTARKYSSVHVKTGSYDPGVDSSHKYRTFDFLGRGTDQYCVYRPSIGTWFTQDVFNQHSIFPWGDASFFPFRGDFDGDGVIDPGLMTVLGGYYYYYVQLSTGGLHHVSWGMTGDYVVIGDYNGDGRDQIAVWRPSEGNWYILDENNVPTVIQWGLPGDIPVPGDFNGDGKTDPAIWRPSTGTWWVRNGISTTDMNPVGQQWGLPGDIPVGEWYGDDHKAKFVVWRPSDGTWYVNDPVAGITLQQWGLPGDIPLSTDHDGNRKSDFTVYRNGIWFNNFRDGNIRATAWGSPGDRLPLKVFNVQ